MIASLKVILLVAALVLFLLDAFGPSSARIRLTPLGLACWLAATMLR